MTDRPIRIVLSTSSESAAPLVEAAPEFLGIDPARVRMDEDVHTVSMWIAGFKVVFVSAVRTVRPYEDVSTDRILGDLGRIVAAVAEDLATRSDQERSRARAGITHAMRIRMLHERSAFLDDDCRDADVMSMHARTPWGPRRVTMSRMADRRSGGASGLTRSTTLDEWPGEPIVCEVAFDPPIERGMITISAYRTSIERPWDIDAIGAMRMIARGPDGGTGDVP